MPPSGWAPGLLVSGQLLERPVWPFDILFDCCVLHDIEMNTFAGLSQLAAIS